MEEVSTSLLFKSRRVLEKVTPRRTLLAKGKTSSRLESCPTSHSTLASVPRALAGASLFVPFLTRSACGTQGSLAARRKLEVVSVSCPMAG